MISTRIEARTMKKMALPLRPCDLAGGVVALLAVELTVALTVSLAKWNTLIRFLIKLKLLGILLFRQFIAPDDVNINLVKWIQCKCSM